MAKNPITKMEYILHFMDYFSRYSFTYATPTANVTNVISALQDLINRFAKPEVIYCDRGQHFENQLLGYFTTEQGVTLTYGPRGSSKSFGLIERGNRILEDVIRKSIPNGETWDTVLQKSTKNVNDRVIAHMRHSPTSILMGIPSSIPVHLVSRDQNFVEADVAQWT